jgi:serine-type D-Ala-D-Ala carboxypeptidase/endopeptidase
MLWHGGGSFGMSAQIVLFPKQHGGYALLANDSCKGTESALEEIAVSLQKKSGSDAAHR